MTAEPAGTAARITMVLREVMQIDVDGSDEDLIESGLIDSLALVEMIFHLEREFGVTIRLDEVSIESFRTIASIAQLLDGSMQVQRER